MPGTSKKYFAGTIEDVPQYRKTKPTHIVRRIRLALLWQALFVRTRSAIIHTIYVNYFAEWVRLQQSAGRTIQEGKNKSNCSQTMALHKRRKKAFIL